MKASALACGEIAEGAIPTHCRNNKDLMSFLDAVKKMREGGCANKYPSVMLSYIEQTTGDYHYNPPGNT